MKGGGSDSDSLRSMTLGGARRRRQRRNRKQSRGYAQQQQQQQQHQQQQQQQQNQQGGVSRRRRRRRQQNGGTIQDLLAPLALLGLHFGMTKKTKKRRSSRKGLRKTGKRRR